MIIHFVAAFRLRDKSLSESLLEPLFADKLWDPSFNIILDPFPSGNASVNFEIELKVGVDCETYNKLHPNYIIQAFWLTNNIKLHKEASNWLCINLALISSRIVFLDRLNLQSPLVLLCIVFRMKAHIRCIGVSSDRQNMQVMMSDPRYLWKGHSIFIILLCRIGDWFIYIIS